MKIFQKRSVAALIMVLAIAAGLFLAYSRKPNDAAAPAPDDYGFRYVLHNEDGALSDETVRYIETVNESLFNQTGAMIVLDVVRSTGSEDIADYADDVFIRYGIGSRERNNGILLVLALQNLYNGAPDGDYYLDYGSGFTNVQAEYLEDIFFASLETDFSAKRYDAGVRKTFDALLEYLEDLYGVNVQAGGSGGAVGNYQANPSYAYGAETQDIPFVLGNIIGLLILLFAVWLILDAFRYRSYRRRSRRFPTPPRYYPIFWGRPRRPRRPPPPPSGFGGAGPRPSGGFHSGGSLGGGARRPSGGFHSGGSLGGGARRPSGGASRPSGGFHRGGSLGGGARRGGGGSRPGGGARRR